jgi:hypothetical protein
MNVDSQNPRTFKSSFGNFTSIIRIQTHCLDKKETKLKVLTPKVKTNQQGYLGKSLPLVELICKLEGWDYIS